MRRVGLAASVAVLLMVVSRVASGGVIYDNASSLGTLIAPYGIVTNPGGGAGGADASFLVSPDGNTGWNANSLNLNRLADDFTVPVGSRWILTGARFLQGQRTLSCDPRNDFRQELDAPPARPPLHCQAMLAGMLLQK